MLSIISDNDISFKYIRAIILENIVYIGLGFAAVFFSLESAWHFTACKIHDKLCEKILDLDINVRICFMSSGEINREASGEIYPIVSLGCFVRKPVTIDYLIKRIMAELD